MAEKGMIIAIDGPAGSGKSTVAALLARRYNYINIETGAMYRALAWKALETGVPLDDEAALADLAGKSRIELQAHPNGNRVLLDGNDVTERIRRQDVTEAASKVSVHPKVRAWMVQNQRELGAAGGIVMEGRDIGTHVFPQADIKIFLDADPVVREQRRMEQQKVSGASAKAMVADLRERDLRDRTRANSPLVSAADAAVIDSTNLSEDEVLARIEALVNEKKIENNQAGRATQS